MISANVDATPRAAPPRLVLRQIQLLLPQHIRVAIESELEAAGLTRGVLCIGPSPIYQESLFVLWMDSDEASFTKTIPRAHIADEGSARAVFRAFVHDIEHR